MLYNYPLFKTISIDLEFKYFLQPWQQQTRKKLSITELAYFVFNIHKSQLDFNLQFQTITKKNEDEWLPFMSCKYSKISQLFPTICWCFDHPLFYLHAQSVEQTLARFFRCSFHSLQYWLGSWSIHSSKVCWWHDQWQFFPMVKFTILLHYDI